MIAPDLMMLAHATVRGMEPMFHPIPQLSIFRHPFVYFLELGELFHGVYVAFGGGVMELVGVVRRATS